MTNCDEPPLILYGVTIPTSARAFLVGQLNLLAGRDGVRVKLIYGSDDQGDVAGLSQAVEQLKIDLARNPSPLRDLVSLVRLLVLLRRLRPRTVVFGTPKMGLVGLLAARISGVSRRIYILYGVRYEGAKGLSRALLMSMEWLAVRCATEVVALSHSSRRELAARGILRRTPSVVLGGGSITGVDLDRFAKPTTDQRNAARESFGLPSDAFVVGFVGRLSRDKGLSDLVTLWPELLSELPNAWLLLVGPSEAARDSERADLAQLQGMDRVVATGMIADPERAFQAMNLQVLLTRREGFGQVILEGAASGVPTVASAVTGTVDAVVDGSTGTLVRLGDLEEASGAIIRYAQDTHLLEQHGTNAQVRAVRHFDSKVVHALWIDHVLGRPLATEASP